MNAEWAQAYEDAQGSPMRLAKFIYDLREDLAALGVLKSLAERDLGELMEDKTLEVPGIGVFEKKTARRRTKWRHDELVPAVVARLVDTPNVVWDEESGERLPGPEAASRLARGMRDCISFGAGKVTGLRALGIQADEYCEEDEAHVSIQLPPRPAPEFGAEA